MIMMSDLHGMLKKRKTCDDRCLCAKHTYGERTIWRYADGVHIPFQEISQGDILQCISYLKQKRTTDLKKCCIRYINERIVCLEKEFNKRMKLTYKE